MDYGAMGAASGGIAGAAASVYAAKKSAKSAKKLMQMQLAWEEAKAKNSIQWTAQDLEKAGINPQLYWAQGGSANSSAGGTLSGQMPDMSGLANSGRQLAEGVKQTLDYLQDLKRTNNETAETNSRIAKNEAETAKIGKETGILTKTGLKEAEARIKNLNTNSAKNIADASTISNTLGKAAEPLGKLANAILTGIGSGVGFFGRALKNQIKESVINSAKKWNKSFKNDGGNYPQL